MPKDILPKPKAKMDWQLGLLPYCKSPEQHPEQVLFYNDGFVCIKDLYPKAQVHLLVMPRKDRDLFELTKDDIPMLQEMKTIGHQMIAKHAPNLHMRMGFHSVPSMKQLHMHVISQDFVSPSLKVKRHYLSMTSHFFKDIDDIISLVESGVNLGILAENEELLKGILECHHCHVVYKTMPALKSHLQTINSLKYLRIIPL